MRVDFYLLSHGTVEAALPRIAINDHRHVQLSPDEVVVFSARAIPVNEKAIARVINHVARRGAEVISEEQKHVHVSGHASDEELKLVLTAQGLDAYLDRYAQGGGYRITLESVADREGLYKLEGKTIRGLSEIPANTTIVNANAQSWDDLLADAQRYPNPDERLSVIIRNQLNGIASALSLLRASQARSDAEMDYATAVIWRYTGHYSGRDGWDRESLVRIPYPELSEAEKAKDRDIWKAVREVLKAHPL